MPHRFGGGLDGPRNPWPGLPVGPRKSVEDDMGVVLCFGSSLAVEVAVCGAGDAPPWNPEVNSEAMIAPRMSAIAARIIKNFITFSFSLFYNSRRAIVSPGWSSFEIFTYWQAGLANKK